MKRLRRLSDGVLYRNPNPGHKVEGAYHPNVVPISDTEVMCFYRNASAMYSVDGKLSKLRSTDGGETWAPDGVVWDPANDEVPFSYHAPHGARMKDGTMVLLASRRDCTDPDQPAFNPETGGMQPRDTVLFRSVDGGHSWSEPEIVDLPGGGLDYTSSQIIELNDGRWFLGCETWKGWDDSSPFQIKGFALFSDDNGKTWADRLDFPSASDAEKIYSHSYYTRMLDGRISTLQWTQDVGASKDFDLHLTVSDDTGTRWSEPRPTGIMGQTSWLADLGDGVLAATYSLRVGMQPGINVILSNDGGKTWDQENQVTVWDAVGQEYLGVMHKPSYPASHDNIAFGAPNTARLPNGEIISSWWCTQACVTHTRFARLAVE